ncbi:MAG: hypothetical protein JXB35_02130 [Anaerolineae bacterium]|nr:hypothetical protein [Anaerolineae bacterium]
MQRQRWILIGLIGAILMAVVLIVGWIFVEQLLQPPIRFETKWDGLAPPVLLEEAKRRADPQAETWAEDAILIKAEATWRPSEDWLQTEYPPVAWSLNYYSAQESAVATVTVHGEQILWVPAINIDSTPTPLPRIPPLQGVDVAWLSFRAAGGEDFLREQQGAAVQFRLEQTSEGPQWTVISYSPTAYYSVIVDAENGQLIAVEEK